MDSLRELPRTVWVLAAGRLVTSASAFLTLFLVIYLTTSRQMDAPSAGLLAGLNGLGHLLGNFTGGRFGDRMGHRSILLLSATIAGVLTAVIPWSPVWLLVLTLPVIGYAAAVSGVSQGALAALCVPVGSRRASVAVTRAAVNAGFVIGPPVGALLATRGYDMLFVVNGVLLLLMRFVTARFLPRDVVAADDAQSGTHPGLWRSLAADRSMLVLLVAIVLADLVYRQLYSTLPLHLNDHGQPLGLYAGLIALGSGLILLLEIPVAMWLRKRDAIPIIALGYGLVAAGFTLFGSSWPSVAFAAVVAMVVLTAGEILYKTTATAHVLDAAPAHLTGQYQGIYTGAATSGTMLSAPLGGLVYASTPQLLWPLCGAVALLAALLVLLSARLKRGGRSY